MQNIIMAILTWLLIPLSLAAQGQKYLKLPNQELLSSSNVLFVMEDSEGCLWYATEGGGVCRDDGRQMDIFRSDAERPELLGSNNVGCLAEAKHHIIIGTFHGAYALDKNDFNIRRLEKVDDKRVDDILLLHNGDVLLTANMKVYRFDSTLTLRATYISPQKYVARLFEDGNGRIWATQWEGGLLYLKGDSLVEAPWPLDAAPTVLADDSAGCLWVGTLGNGIVRYHPDKGSVDLQPQAGQGICTDLKRSASGDRLYACTIDRLQVYKTGEELKAITLDSIMDNVPMAMGRMSLDHHGRLLVANRQGESFAIGNTLLWNTGGFLTTQYADSVRMARQLSSRPTAITYSEDGTLWFSTGKDIRRKAQASEVEDVVLPDTKDVAAMTFSADGTLWLGTIFGQLYRYKDGQLTTDSYAANEHGDGIIAMNTDSTGRLVIVYDRYVRIYDTERHTLRQQSREADGVYCIELQETMPDGRWSQPERDIIVELVPKWLTSWWMWCVYLLVVIGIVALAIYNYILRRQRDKFLEMMKAPAPSHTTSEETSESQTTPSALEPQGSLLLQKAIAQVEKNLSNDQYTVEELSNDLCMSRMTLYRKIQSLTGQKPTEFIRTIRLRRAAELLREGQLTVTEVSYATGFSSVSYFSRCFRTMYSVPPTQFGKETTADDRAPSEIPN